MMPKSAFLADIVDYAKTSSRVQCVYACKDQVVVCDILSFWSPTRLGREDDICIPIFGHMNLFMGDAAINRVKDIVLTQAEKDQ